MRIVSLVPSATSLVYELGLDSSLVGVSHQCDRPESAAKPLTVTRSRVTLPSSPDGIHESVQQHSAAQVPLYQVDTALLQSLNPDVVLTQDTCTVCSVSTDLAQHAVIEAALPSRILPVNISSLSQLFAALEQLGEALDVRQRAADLTDMIQGRLQRVQRAVYRRNPVTVLAAEWVDPLLPGGTLINELLQIAGAQPLLPPAGTDGGELPWDQVLSADPQVILAFPCGCSLEEAVQHAHGLAQRPHWNQLQAVRQGRVFVLDGSVCTRHDARIAQVAQLFAQLIHPDALDDPIPSGIVVPWSDKGREAV